MASSKKEKKKNNQIDIAFKTKLLYIYKPNGGEEGIKTNYFEDSSSQRRIKRSFEIWQSAGKVCFHTLVG